jgi:methylmalonyl-CoA mutase C-terminal domain/subunit
MKKRKMTNVLLCGGGVIPPEDVTALNKKGVGRLFGPGTDTRDIVTYLNEKLPEMKN